MDPPWGSISCTIRVLESRLGVSFFGSSRGSAFMARQSLGAASDLKMAEPRLWRPLEL